jgi:phosphotransferase system enzyme I (PtsI)
MIETPSAALTADSVLAQVDFASLGTNDLAQYTMAADRLVGELAALNDPWQPAVLRAIELACSAGAAAGKPVGVCGEAAADPVLAAVLVGLGVTSLSMSARALGRVAESLLGATLEQCRAAATVAALAINPAEARAAALGALGR